MLAYEVQPTVPAQSTSTALTRTRRRRTTPAAADTAPGKRAAVVKRDGGGGRGGGKAPTGESRIWRWLEALGTGMGYGQW